jgi:dipeptidyl-peptidase-4
MGLILMTLLTTTPDDAFLKDFAETRRYTAGRPVGVKVTPDGSAAIYLRSGPKDAQQVLYSLDLATSKETVLLTPELVLKGGAETLSVAEKARLERMRVSARGFTSFKLSQDGAKLLVTLSGKLYVVERAGGHVTALNTGAGACLDPSFSPDGKLVAYVRENDLRVVDLATNHEKPVTHGGTELIPHGLAEFVAQEEMGRFSGYWFSPDSKAIAYQQTDHTGVERFGIADPMHPEAEANRFFYPRPGKQNASVRLFVQALSGGPAAEVKWDRTAFPYLATVRWEDGPLTVLVMNREQTKEQLLTVDEQHTAKAILTEEDASWLNLSQAFPKWWKGVGFFWMTERNGAPELELRNADGTLKASWVRPEAGFRELAGFVEQTKTLWYTGGANPTEAALFKVVDGAPPEQVTREPGMDHASISKANVVVLNHATASRMPHTSLLSADGARLADVPAVAIEPALTLSREVLKLDGEPGSWAAVIRPASFVKGQKYPVILDVYGGPHAQQVTQTPALLSQWIADQGFILVRLDGRGTPGRGRAWERAIAGDFATTIAGDQLAGLKALGQKFPELDLERVGVMGWSFGGYLSALLAMAHGDVVKSAVVGAPVSDWLDYDTFYTERYLGLPGANPKAYEVSSLLTKVNTAKRPMLIMHGTADDNVYFMHTLKLSDALFRAGVPHVVLPLANFTHMVPDALVTQRQYQRVVQWFKETLAK